jgi:hypothetical protein
MRKGKGRWEGEVRELEECFDVGYREGWEGKGEKSRGGKRVRNRSWAGVRTGKK